MVRVQVVIVEHGREYRYTVAEEASIDDAHDLIDRLQSHFASDGRVRVVSDGEE